MSSMQGDAPDSAVMPTVIDRYAIEGLLGRGAFGAVYRARHLHTRQVVALKVLRAAALRLGQTSDHLMREAQVLAAVKHPNIVQVFDAGIFGDVAFFAMELVEGEGLDDMLDRGCLSFAQIAWFADQLLRGLGAAHNAGVIHRDIKPANLSIVGGQTLKILDFGISKADLLDGNQRGAVHMAGTPGFMAPEQLKTAAVDARADLYAVGATLFVLATNRLPFDEQTLERLLARQERERAPLLSTLIPTAPESLVLAIDRALSRDPDARFGSAEEFRLALLPRANHAPGSVTHGGAPVATERTHSSSGTRSLPASAAPILPRAREPGYAPGSGYAPATMSSGAAAFAAAEHATLPQVGGVYMLREPSQTLARTRTKWATWSVVGAALLAAGGAAAWMRNRHIGPFANRNASAEVAATTAGGGNIQPADPEHGLAIEGRPWATRTGHFTTTQQCTLNQNLRFEHAVVEVPDGDGIVLDTNCNLELLDTQVRAKVGVRSAESAVDVAMHGGEVVATETAFLFEEAATLKAVDAQITAPAGVIAHGPNTMTFTRTKVDATGIAIDATTTEFIATESSFAGSIGMSMSGAGSADFRGGSVKGGTHAFVLAGVSHVSVHKTAVTGDYDKSALSTIEGDSYGRRGSGTKTH